MPISPGTVAGTGCPLGGSGGRPPALLPAWGSQQSSHPSQPPAGRCTVPPRVLLAAGRPGSAATSSRGGDARSALLPPSHVWAATSGRPRPCPRAAPGGGRARRWGGPWRGDPERSLGPAGRRGRAGGVRGSRSFVRRRWGRGRLAGGSTAQAARLPAPSRPLRSFAAAEAGGARRARTHARTLGGNFERDMRA